MELYKNILNELSDETDASKQEHEAFKGDLEIPVKKEDGRPVDFSAFYEDGGNERFKSVQKMEEDRAKWLATNPPYNGNISPVPPSVYGMFSRAKERSNVNDGDNLLNAKDEIAENITELPKEISEIPTLSDKPNHEFPSDSINKTVAHTNEIVDAQLVDLLRLLTRDDFTQTLFFMDIFERFLMEYKYKNNEAFMLYLAQRMKYIAKQYDIKSGKEKRPNHKKCLRTYTDFRKLFDK